MRSHARFNKRLARRYDEWMIAMHYSERTKDYYRKVIQHFCHFLGKRSVASATHVEVREFVAMISERSATLETTYRYLGVLRQFYDFLNLGGIVSYVAPRLVRLRRPIPKRLPILTELQVQKLMAAARTKREKALVEAYYSTGCRCRELTHLRVEDVDMVTRTARVRGKFGKVRTVFLTASAMEALKAYLENRRTGFVFQEDRPVQKGCLACRDGSWRAVYREYVGRQCRAKSVLLGPLSELSYEAAKEKFDELLSTVNLTRPMPDRPLTNTLIQYILLKVGNRAGLKNVGSHMLRRTFASHMYDRGVSLEVLQALMGHSYMQTTVTYLRLSPGVLAQSFDRYHPGGESSAPTIAEERRESKSGRPKTFAGPVHPG